MLLSGIQPFTLLDYPGKTACVLFTPGCNFRCGYCHNPEFVLPELLKKIAPSFIGEEAAFRFLDERRGLLDGVVISGGEPTLMPDLLPFIRRVKENGFLVKLDTNGNRPKVLEAALREGNVDYVAMDLKTSPDRYPELAGPLANPEAIRESIQILMRSDVPHEFRATMVRELHLPETVEAMRQAISGAERFVLQRFRPGKTLCEKFGSYATFDDEEFEEMRRLFLKDIREVLVR